MPPTILLIGDSTFDKNLFVREYTNKSAYKLTDIPNYSVDAIIIYFNLDNELSFNRVPLWLMYVSKYKCVIYLFGIKSRMGRVVPYDTVLCLASRLGIKYYEDESIFVDILDNSRVSGCCYM